MKLTLLNSTLFFYHCIFYDFGQIHTVRAMRPGFESNYCRLVNETIFHTIRLGLQYQNAPQLKTIPRFGPHNVAEIATMKLFGNRRCFYSLVVKCLHFFFIWFIPSKAMMPARWKGLFLVKENEKNIKSNRKPKIQ